MATAVTHEQCPKCASQGKDRHEDNLGVYQDGSAYCYSCGYSRGPTFRLKYLIAQQEKPNAREKAVLPSDLSLIHI